MERLDQEMQRRVWQRVQSREEGMPPGQQPESLKALLLLAQENNAAYTRLLRHSGQRDTGAISRLQREIRSSIACMQGVCRACGEPGKVPRLNAPRDPARRALEKCYHRERKLCTEWESRISDPEHGVVFRRLAEQGRARCALIMEMLGKMPEQ